MGTRSDIIVECVDGKFRRVYCHWDGYPSHNGRILHEAYNSQELAETLVSFGDMSVLGPSCDKPHGHTFDNPVKGYTTFYHRDRGEPFEDTKPKVGMSLLDVTMGDGGCEEYTYVWSLSDKQWKLYTPGKRSGGTMTPLAEMSDVTKVEAETLDVAIVPPIEIPKSPFYGRF